MISSWLVHRSERFAPGIVRWVRPRINDCSIALLFRTHRGGDEVIEEMLLNVEAQDGLVGAVEAAYDRELLDEALRRVRERVPAQQWDAFKLTALESMSGADASRALGMLVSTVYSSKSKVQKLVREELQRLDI